MPYALEFYLLLFVAEVAVFLVARSLAPLGLGVNSVFAFAAAYAIVIGGWVLGRKNLDASTALAMLTDALAVATLKICARLKCSPEVIDQGAREHAPRA
jgi:hypothetical protein